MNHGRFLCSALLAAALLSGCGGKKPQASATDSVEPDKVLYERAQEDMRKGRHIAARLELQTLINAYPDSEYLAQAKLAICESFYQEGGTAGLTQAVAECKDFITFFPFLPEAPYAQMKVGMAHYRRMEKPDRDRTYARLAEEEFQEFLRRYPSDPLAVQAEQRLREVQEVLAEGDFRIARYYYIKGSFRASAGRLMEMVDRYPLYSNTDRALLMLGDIFERSEKGELGARFFARIIRDYPLSPLVEEAKKRLDHLGVPAPQPDPKALARMQQERDAERQKPGMLRRSLGMFRSGPDVSMAAKAGQPQMQPPVESPVSETLTRGDLIIQGAPTGNTGSGNSGSSGGTTGSTGSTGTSGSDPAASSSSTPTSQLPARAKTKKEKKKKEPKKKDDKKPEEKKDEQESSSKKKKN